MKRSTLVTLVLFLVLLAVWWLQTRPTPPSPLPALSIPGYLGDVPVEEARRRAVTERAPWRNIALQRMVDGKLELVELVQDVSPVAASADRPPVEAKWSGKRTVDGKTESAGVQAYRAAAITELWQRTTHANYAVRLTPSQLAEYGLDDAHVISIELSGGGETLRLRVGHLHTGDRSARASDLATWVQDASRPDVAYQVVDRDLRTPLAVPWAELQERKAAPVSPVDSPAAPTPEAGKPSTP